jgi:hypothetical protein
MFYEPPHKWTEELLDDLPFGEDNRYERKSGDEISKNKFDDFFNKLAKELGAFANSFGGTLFVGVTDDKKKIGIPGTVKGKTPTERWLENKIPTLFELRLQHFRISRVELTEQTQRQIGSDNIIVAIDVFDSELAPHQCVFDHKYYYRSNSESRPAPHHYLAFLWGRANSNMSHVATWWIRDFLNPLVELLAEVHTNFEKNIFPLTPLGIQHYGGIDFYGINFFKRERWIGLLSSSVGEYFLSTFPLIEKELISFAEYFAELDKAISNLERTIEESAFFLKHLKDIYERLIAREHIPRSQFENYNLQEMARHLLGQLQLRISNYPTECKDTLVHYTAYKVMGLSLSHKVPAQAEDEKLLSFCRDISNELKDKDESISKPLEVIGQLLDVIKDKSLSLLKQLKKERIEIAKRYTATFGT